MQNIDSSSILTCKEHFDLFGYMLVPLNSSSASKSWSVNDCEVVVEYGGIKCVCSDGFGLAVGLTSETLKAKIIL